MWPTAYSPPIAYSFPMPSESPIPRLIKLWRTLSPLPGGPWLFSRCLGFAAPYSGSIRPRVMSLEPGLARIELRDRRGVRNHLDSIHAIALANLGELTSGLALLTGLPASVRGILVGISVEYLKKARGTLTAEARPSIPTVGAAMDHEVNADIRDAAGDVVARVTARWRLGQTASGAGSR
jgi:acyl-coenzyme A thioesterase PaaI-like protein